MISAPVLAVACVTLLAAFAISVVATPIVRRWSIRRDFVDRPGGPAGHKTHGQAVALGGGAAIFAAIVLPVVVGLLAARMIGESGAQQMESLNRLAPDASGWVGGLAGKLPLGLAVAGGACVLFIVGLIDDRRPLSPGLKLAVQLTVAVALTAKFGIRSATALGTVPSVVITTLWIVTLVNSFNFLDNMDGLSAGVSAIVAIILALTSMLAGQVFVPCLLMLVAGAALGFLIYNRSPATIFMGDAGSMVLGYFLAVASVLTTFYDPEMGRTPYGFFVPLVVFAVPLYDLASVVVHRYRQGAKIFAGDQRHFSHRLVARGLSRKHAVWTIYLATVATALPAILLPLHGWPVALLIFAQCLCVVAIIAVLESCDAK